MGAEAISTVVVIGAPAEFSLRFGFGVGFGFTIGSENRRGFLKARDFTFGFEPFQARLQK